MTQLTIRISEEQLHGRIAALARERGWSLNRATLQLLRLGAGLAEQASRPEPGIGDALDLYVGGWKAAEATKFDRRIEAAFERIDEEMWRS